MTLVLRSARLADAPLLRAWDRDPAIEASGGSDGDFDWDTELPRDVPWRGLLIAEQDGRPIGFMQIIDARHEATHYWGEIEEGIRAIDIWIGAAGDRGHGHGTAMLRLALERCFASAEVKAVLIDPLVRNTDALRFYERIGFRRVGPRRVGDDDCYVYRMERADWVAV